MQRLRRFGPKVQAIPAWSLFFGDHEVFGVSSEEGVQLWFFNPNFVPGLPDARPFLPMEESG